MAPAVGGSALCVDSDFTFGGIVYEMPSLIAIATKVFLKKNQFFNLKS